MSFRCLKEAQHGHIRIVHLNRPERANASNYELLVELEACAFALREDADTRAVIFTGTGKHFCSGMDLRDGDTSTLPMVVRRRRHQAGARAIRALRGIDQITIAAWNGAAIGGGACLATALDFRIGASDCFMQYPEIDIGMNLMWESLPLIVHLVGPARAKRLVAGGERLHAPTLRDWGILDEMVEPAELLPRALAFAEFYAAKPPVAAQMIKQSVNRIVSALDQSLMHMDGDQNLFCRTQRDQSEAIAAYLEKRTPRYTGD